MDDDNLKDPRDDELIREGSNLHAFLFTARKAHLELDEREIVLARFEQIRTKGHARQYFEEIMPRLLNKRAERRRGTVG